MYREWRSVARGAKARRIRPPQRWICPTARSGEGGTDSATSGQRTRRPRRQRSLRRRRPRSRRGMTLDPVGSDERPPRQMAASEGATGATLARPTATRGRTVRGAQSAAAGGRTAQGRCRRWASWSDRRLQEATIAQAVAAGRR